MINFRLATRDWRVVERRNKRVAHGCLHQLHTPPGAERLPDKAIHIEGRDRGFVTRILVKQQRPTASASYIRMAMAFVRRQTTSRQETADRLADLTVQQTPGEAQPTRVTAEVSQRRHVCCDGGRVVPVNAGPWDTAACSDTAVGEGEPSL
jgi:hypothetical protein